MLDIDITFAQFVNHFEHARNSKGIVGIAKWNCGHGHCHGGHAGFYVHDFESISENIGMTILISAARKTTYNQLKCEVVNVDDFLFQFIGNSSFTLSEYVEKAGR